MTSEIVCKRLYICNRKNNLIRVDEKCYTEDRVLIYYLYVSNIPAEIGIDPVRAYFETYGEVEDINYTKKYQTALKEQRASAIVKYKTYQAASKALRRYTHKIGSVRLVVRGADSWIQPRKIRDPFKVDDNDIESFMILKLNHDCILHLFMYIKYNDKELTLDSNALDSLSLMDIKDSFLLIGKTIERLYVNCNIERFNRIYDFILKSFPNLKRLYMEDLADKVCKESNKEIPRFLPKLTHLKLKNCYVNDKHVRKLNKLRHLEYLNLSSNPKLLGKHIHNLGNLKSLEIQNCNSIHLPNLKNLMNMSLKFLNVFGVEHFDTVSVLSHMLLKAECLEEFHTSSFKSNNENLKIIPKMKSLKRIRISFLKIEQNDTGLKQFLESCLENKKDILEYLGLITKDLHLTKENVQSICRLKNLKELELVRIKEADCIFWTNLNFLKELKILKFCYALNDFDENAFISWLKKASNIQRIEASFIVYKIKIDFVNQLIDVLNELHGNNQKVHIDIVCALYEVDGNMNILKDPKYLTSRSLVNVTLKAARDLQDMDDDFLQPTTLNLLQQIIQNNLRDIGILIPLQDDDDDD